MGLPKEAQWGEQWSDRQERIEGFDQKKIREATIWVCGCNGLGRTASEILIRKGYGRVVLIDDDVVESSNLNRTFWRPNAIGKFKVIQALEELCDVVPGRS